jgi:hypothetical protein
LGNIKPDKDTKPVVIRDTGSHFKGIKVVVDVLGNIVRKEGLE